MNKTVENFLESLKVDIEEFSALESAKIKNRYDVNSIVAEFKLLMPKMEKRIVSIADVEGYEYENYGLSDNIIYNLSHFFDAESGGYQSRSVSMLEIPTSELMNKLSKSFVNERVHLNEVDKGKYSIGNNGLHRFNVMKMHYLCELKKLDANDNQGREALRKKYSFEADVSQIDFVKTYSSYILSLVNDKIKITNHFDEDYSITDKVRLYDYSSEQTKEEHLTREQLVEVVKSEVSKFLQRASEEEIDDFKKLLEEKCTRFESLKEYYNDVLSLIIEGEDENESGEN